MQDGVVEEPYFNTELDTELWIERATRIHRDMQSTGICNVRARVSFLNYQSLGLARLVFFNKY